MFTELKTSFSRETGAELRIASAFASATRRDLGGSFESGLLRPKFLDDLSKVDLITFKEGVLITVIEKSWIRTNVSY